MREDSHPGAADILVPVRNHYARTRALLESVYRHTDNPFHIYVVDNASKDETVDLGKIYTRDITVVRNRTNRGWSGAINQGIRLGSNPYLVFLSNEVELAECWLENMLAFLNTHPRIAAVGPLRSDADSWQWVDQVRETMVPEIPRFLTEDIHERNRILQYHFHNTGILIDGVLSFSCAVLSRRAVAQVGQLNGGNANEIGADYCARLRRAGFVLGLSLDTYVIHTAGAGREAAMQAAFQKQGDALPGKKTRRRSA